MGIFGEFLPDRIGSTTTAMAKIGLGFGEDIATRVINNEQVARELRRLRCAAEEANLLLAVKQHPEDYRDDPTEIAQRLVDICVQKDPDAPLEQHAIGVIGALIDYGVDTANITTLQRILGEPPSR